MNYQPTTSVKYSLETFTKMLHKQTDAELYDTFKKTQLQYNAVQTFNLVGIPIEADDAFWALERAMKDRKEAVDRERDSRVKLIQPL